MLSFGQMDDDISWFCFAIGHEAQPPQVCWALVCLRGWQALFCLLSGVLLVLFDEQELPIMISIFLRTSLILSFLFWHLPLCCIYHVLTYRYVLVKYIGISCFRFGLWDFFLRKSFLQNCCKCSPFFFSSDISQFYFCHFFSSLKAKMGLFFFFPQRVRHFMNKSPFSY